jgi:prolipoprotein diacylglyceryl transferase
VTGIPATVVLSIPSPSKGVWDIFGFPVRAYALCIITGIVVAMVITHRRWQARGGTGDNLEMAVVVGVPLGIVGARLYHVVTDYQLYFGPGRHPVDALKIWNGGLGVWGAIAFGVLGGYLVARRRGMAFPALLDAAAPGIAVAQGIGRLGNWFNQELFGRPTTLPWGLEIAPAYRPPGFEQYATFHPTFLYELIWDVAIAIALVLLDRRFRLGHGKVFALYVAFYTLGRFWIEALRIDRVNEIGGFRLNNYTSLILFVAACAWFGWLVRNRPGREERVERPPAADDRSEAADEEGDAEVGEATGGADTTEAGAATGPAGATEDAAAGAGDTAAEDSFDAAEDPAGSEEPAATKPPVVGADDATGQSVSRAGGAASGS